MVRLLQIEFIKLWNNRANRILIISYFALLTSIALIAAIKFDIGPIEFHLAKQGIFNFPYIWHFNTFMASWFKLFLAIVIVSMVSSEYSNKTIKQNLIDGLSKKEFILSKFLTTLSFSVISTVFIFIVSIVLGYAYSDYDEFAIVFSDLEFLLAYFVKMLGFFSMCLFFGMLLKRSAFALGFMIILFFIEFFSYLYVGSQFTYELAEKIYAFAPFGSMWQLVHEPFSRLSAVQSIGDQIGENLRSDYSVHWYQILIVLIWVAIYIYSSYKLLEKRDL